jgi:hypothetical protein
MSNTVENLDRGVSGTSATLDKMHQLVAQGKLDPTFQKIATWIRTTVPQDRRGKTKDTADAIFNWVKASGIFQSDPFQIEKIESPIEAMRPIIQARQAGTYTGPGLFVGDCDTFAIVTATLGGILGFQYAFETAKVDASRPDEFSHVWTALLVDGDWYPLDSSTPGAYPGWRPPVDPSLLARWPEQPIENVIRGAQMSIFNRGLGDNQTSPTAPIDTAYPKDYVGYGVPKDFGAGPGVIPQANFDDLQLLPPHETQIPDADMQPDMHLLKAGPLLNPSERIQSIDGYPTNDHGNPYYQTQNTNPRYKVESQFYPPGSRWNGKYGQDSVRYVRTGAYVKTKSAESPERQVRANMAQPMMVRRRIVMANGRQIPFGAMEGLGQDDTSGLVTSLSPDSSGGSTDTSGMVTSLSPSPAPTPTPATAPAPAPAAAPPSSASIMSTAVTANQLAPTPTPAASSSPSAAAAAAAGGSVWTSIASAFQAAGTIAPAAMQSSLMQSVIAATNKLAGKNVLAPGVVPWYLNPVTLAFFGIIGVGTYYVMHKNRPGSSGRRRR